MKTTDVVAAALVAGLICAGGLHAQAVQYTKQAEIHIGGSPQFDYLAVDPIGKRLYVSNGTQIVVIDTTSNAVVGKIADTPGVHGIAITEPGSRGFTSNGREGKSSIVDLRTLQTIRKVDVGAGPDAILYEPKMKEVYAINHTAGTATVVNAATGAPVTTIKLSGTSAETAVADPGLGRVYVNLEEDSKIDVIDVAAHKVIATWPVAPAEGPTGLAIDTATHRLFSGGDKFTVMIDGQSGKVVGQMPICDGTDATFFDPGTKLVFSSCGDGTVTIGREDSPAKLSVVQTLSTVRGARTMALDPATHKIYVVGQNFQPPASASTASAQSGRRGAGPPAVQDSFKVIVYGMK